MLSRLSLKSNMFSMFSLFMLVIFFFCSGELSARTASRKLIRLSKAEVSEENRALRVQLSFQGRPSVRNIKSGTEVIAYDFFPAVFPEIRSEAIVSSGFASSVVIAQHDNSTVRVAVKTSGGKVNFGSGLSQGKKGVTVYTLDFSGAKDSQGDSIEGYLGYSSSQGKQASILDRLPDYQTESVVSGASGKDSFLEALSQSVAALRESNRRLPGKRLSPLSGEGTTPFEGRTWTVVIDPGHGGKDPGAPGKKLHEKDLVLATAFEVVRELNRIPFIKVVMTRTRDEFVRLSKRAAMAEKSKADLFVSLHCNSSLKKKSSGFEVYTLSRDGASDKVAHEVAMKENSVLELENNGAEIEATPMLNQILCSMMMTDTMNQSVLLAGFIGKEAKKMPNLVYRGHKNANFYVLRSLKVPAVLVEMGFISNASEAKLMGTRKWQKTMAARIAGGIQNYLNHVMMREGEFEDLATCDYYVKKGDTLGGIARRYKTSVSNIVRLNSIEDGNNIIPGQTLKVPGDPVASLLWETSQ